MKALPVNVSSFPYVSNRLDGKPVADQISELLLLQEILTDAFSATYQSKYFRLGEKRIRFAIASLQTAFNLEIKRFIECSLEGINIDQQMDWNRIEVNQDTQELAIDLDAYLNHSLALIAVFDCFFNDDSMKGESPQSFIDRCLETRNFFLQLMGACVQNTYASLQKEPLPGKGVYTIS